MNAGTENNDEITEKQEDHQGLVVDIKDKLWNGCVNVRVRFVTGAGNAEFLFPAFRMSYLPCFFPSIVRYFQHYKLDLGTTPIWLEYEDVPLKWHLPVGLLYDYLHLPSASSESRHEWILTLRYGEYPSEHLIPFKEGTDYIGTLKEVVVNQLKQSCFVLNGNSKNIMNLSESKSIELWESIQIHNLKYYSSINKRIVPALSKIHKVPVKIVIPGFASTIQAPVFPRKNDKMTTLGDILYENLPEIFDSNLGIPYIHGIAVENAMDAPIVEVWDLFKHLDNFLYIIVILQQ